MNTMQRPSWVITTVALLVAALSLGLTAWYLWAGMPITTIHLAIAGVVVLVPLTTRWPLSPERALKTAAVWAVAGSFPAGYIFGGYVFLAGLILAGSALLFHFLENHQPTLCRRVRIGSAPAGSS
jgi:hypothetical protein